MFDITLEYLWTIWCGRNGLLGSGRCDAHIIFGIFRFSFTSYGTTTTATTTTTIGKLHLKFGSVCGRWISTSIEWMVRSCCGCFSSITITIFISIFIFFLLPFKLSKMVWYMLASESMCTVYSLQISKHFPRKNRKKRRRLD